jgi:hypothetical protein
VEIEGGELGWGGQDGARRAIVITSKALGFRNHPITSSARRQP